MLYVAGGIGKFRMLKSCEAFSVAAQNWTKCPDLPSKLHQTAFQIQLTQSECLTCLKNTPIHKNVDYPVVHFLGCYPIRLSFIGFFPMQNWVAHF